MYSFKRNVYNVTPVPVITKALHTYYLYLFSLLQTFAAFKKEVIRRIIRNHRISKRKKKQVKDG